MTRGTDPEDGKYEEQEEEGEKAKKRKAMLGGGAGPVGCWASPVRRDVDFGAHGTGQGGVAQARRTSSTLEYVMKQCGLKLRDMAGGIQSAGI